MATCTISVLAPIHSFNAVSFTHHYTQLRAHISYLESLAKELEIEVIQHLAEAKKTKRFMDNVVADAAARKATLEALGVAGLNEALKESRTQFLTRRRIAAEKWRVALDARAEIRHAENRLFGNTAGTDSIL